MRTKLLAGITAPALRGGLVVTALCCLLLAACTERTTVTAPTQVMLRIYNNDPALLELMSDLSVSFSLRQNDSWREYAPRTFAKKVLSWPVDIPIIPSTRQDAFKQFEVVVRALERGQVLAETRAISSFVPDERRVLEVWLFSCPSTDQAVCAAPDCHGEACEVCRTDGTCVAVGATDPRELPRLMGDETPGQKEPPSITHPVERGGMDSGVDAMVDGHVPPDAGDAMPAEPPDGNVPDDGVMTLPGEDCSTLQCDGNATCVMADDAPSCQCNAGYADVSGTCEDIDECMADDHGGCSVNASCENTVGGRTCTCMSGFDDVRGDGTECTDKCASAGCHTNATCAIVAGEAQCTCLPAYLGDGKNECTFDSQCEQLNCDANATCKVSGGNRICECNAGYEGDGNSCVNPNACVPTNPCLNGGTCSDGLDEFSCACRNGFSGPTCATNNDDCTPNPCMNSGVCSDLIADFSCNCDNTGFSGRQCQTNVPDCPSGACTPGGNCVDGVKDYSCSCNAGYDTVGKTCANHNDCPSGACMPGGNCVDGLQTYSCNCTVAGYVASGMACVDKNDCSPNPCQNGGRCSDLLNDFSCDCTNTGFVGKRCDTRSAGCANVGEPCTVGVGECRNTGVYVCNGAGTMQSCSVSPKAPSTEICDGKDNNCVDGIDEAPAPTCIGQILRHCVSPTLTDTMCAATGETCFNNDCGGQCAVTTNRCSGGNSQQCNGVGMWAPHPTHATCTTNPPERCNDATGLCVDNTPFPLGNSVSGGTSFPITNNRLLAQPIIPNETLKLVNFGIRSTTTSLGSSVYLSLHNDASSQPGTLMNRSGQFTMQQNSANIQAPVSALPAAITLTKDVRYWIVANFALGGSDTPSIFINPSSAAGACRVGTRTFAVPGDLAAGSTSLSNGEFTLFIQVQR